MLAALLLLTLAAPPDETARARGRELTQQAKTAFEQGAYQKAAELFLEAHDWAREGGLGDKPQLLFNAAVSFDRAGRCDRVVDLLTAYLKRAPNDRTREVRTRLAAARRCAPVVRVRAEPKASVWIDAQARGETPTELALMTGAHTLKLVAEGFEPLQRNFEVRPGVPLTLNFRLKAVEREASVRFDIAGRHSLFLGDTLLGTGPTTLTRPLAISTHQLRITAPGCPEERLNLEVPGPDAMSVRAEIAGCTPSSPSPVGAWPWVAFGGGAAAVAVSVTLGLLTRGAVNRRSQALDDLDLGAVQGAERDARTFAIGAYASGAAAALLLVAAGTLFLWPSNEGVP